ncbi:MAG: hypothetical protein AUH15_09785 [Acidobacteriales bacterium 13_2_20CM_55_8]|nr:MAG: hypothetical protein AUH15_09785 [Acidobacteriales bacterium 13_2_20CM_55_8]
MTLRTAFSRADSDHILLRTKKWQAPEFPGSDPSAPASGHKEDSKIMNTLFVIPNESGFFCNSKRAVL